MSVIIYDKLHCKLQFLIPIIYGISTWCLLVLILHIRYVRTKELNLQVIITL